MFSPPSSSHISDRRHTVHHTHRQSCALDTCRWLPRSCLSWWTLGSDPTPRTAGQSSAKYPGVRGISRVCPSILGLGGRASQFSQQPSQPRGQAVESACIRRGL